NSPVAAFKQNTMSTSLVFPIVYARPLLTETDENPSPAENFQSTFGAAAGHSVLTLRSLEIPFRFGPRNCGQSKAGSSPAATHWPKTNPVVNKNTRRDIKLIRSSIL